MRELLDTALFFLEDAAARYPKGILFSNSLGFPNLIIDHPISFILK
jgi:hypothetical protein